MSEDKKKSTFFTFTQTVCLYSFRICCAAKATPTEVTMIGRTGDVFGR